MQNRPLSASTSLITTTRPVAGQGAGQGEREKREAEGWEGEWRTDVVEAHATVYLEVEWC